MREYKIGDLVIYINKMFSDYWEKKKGVSLYRKLAKIIDIDNDNSLPYLLEFKEWVNGHDGHGSKIKGKKGHCWWCSENEFKLAIDYLKFKKWIKG